MRVRKFELITACKPYGCGVWARVGGEYGRGLPEGEVAITLFISLIQFLHDV